MSARVFRRGDFVFTLAFWPTFLTAIMLVVLIGLGFWQLQRLTEKENLLNNLNQRMHQQSLSVDRVDINDADFRPAWAKGQFIPEKQIYMHSISRLGEGGYRVLTPLRLEGRPESILVDRGWISFASRKHQDFATPLQVITIKGVLKVPHTTWLTPHNDPLKDDWFWPEFSQIEKTKSIPSLLPFLLVEEPAASGAGYPRSELPILDLPNNHLAYALTWFGLAMALVLIYGLSQCRRGSS